MVQTTEYSSFTIFKFGILKNRFQCEHFAIFFPDYTKHLAKSTLSQQLSQQILNENQLTSFSIQAMGRGSSITSRSLYSLGRLSIFQFIFLKMSYWRVLKNRFGMASPIVNSLVRLCRDTLEPLESALVMEVIHSLNQTEVSVEFEDFTEMLYGKMKFSSISWLKFVMFLSQCDKQPKIMEWLLQFSPTNQRNNDNDLQHRVRNLADKLFFYIKRKAANKPEEMDDKLGSLYRLTNQLHRLLSLHQALHHIFTRYSNIPVVHQTYSNLLKEVRQSYEDWKQTYKTYVKHICQENVGFYLTEITQLMESGKKLHKEIRQFYFLTQLLTADEQTQEMRVQPPKIVEIPEECARKIADVRRKLKGFSMTTSLIMSNSIGPMPRNMTKSTNYVPLPKTIQNQKDIQSSSQSDEQGHV